MIAKKKKKDARVQKTRLALRDALLELIVERGYENSSVQDILDRASVGRATFYAHYWSKEDLLRQSLDVLREHLIEEWKASAAGARSPLGFSRAFFRHVDEHRPLYRAIVGRESGVILTRQMRRLLADLVASDLASEKGAARGVREDLAVQFVVGAMMSVMHWWLDRSIKLSAEEVDRLFRQMTVPALRAVRNAAG